jgi:hypothetical protein
MDPKDLGMGPEKPLFETMKSSSGEFSKKPSASTPVIRFVTKITRCNFVISPNPVGNGPAIKLFTATRFSSSTKRVSSNGIAPTSPLPSALAGEENVSTS